MFDRLPSEINSMIFTKVPARDLLTLKTVNRIGRIMAIEELFNNRRGKDACEAQTELLNSWILERADILKNIRENPYERKKWVEILSACLKDEASDFAHQLTCMVFLGEIIGSPFMRVENESIGKTYGGFLIRRNLGSSINLKFYPSYDKDQQTLLIDTVVDTVLNFNLVGPGVGSEISAETADVLLTLAQLLPKLSKEHRSLIISNMESHGNRWVLIAHAIGQVLSHQINKESLVQMLFSWQFSFPLDNALTHWILDNAPAASHHFIFDRLLNSGNFTDLLLIRRKYKLIMQLIPHFNQEMLLHATVKLLDYMHTGYLAGTGYLVSAEKTELFPCLLELSDRLNDSQRNILLPIITRFQASIPLQNDDQAYLLTERNNLLAGYSIFPASELLNDSIACIRMHNKKDMEQAPRQRIISQFMGRPFPDNRHQLFTETIIAVGLAYFIQEIPSYVQNKIINVLLLAAEQNNGLLHLEDNDSRDVKAFEKGVKALLLCLPFMDQNQLEKFTASLCDFLNVKNETNERGAMIILKNISSLVPQLIQSIKTMKSDQTGVRMIQFALKHAEIFGIPVKNEGNTSTMNNKAF